MKKFWILFVLIGLAISTSSFEKNSNKWEKEILGKWSLSGNNEIKLTFLKVEAFEKSKIGFAFFEDGSFIFYSFTGWCGTPPLEFNSSKGRWSKTHDDVIAGSYRTWRGESEFKLFVKEVNETKLVIQFINDKTDN